MSDHMSSLPHLLGAPGWLKTLKIIERVQEKFVKNVHGLSANTYNERLKELNILSLENRRIYLDLVEV